MGVFAEVHSNYFSLLIINIHTIQINSNQRLVYTHPLGENATADRAELEALKRHFKGCLVIAHHFEDMS